MNKELIERLKNNFTVWNGLTDEEQRCLKSVKYTAYNRPGGGGGWEVAEHYFSDLLGLYRIPKDYKPEITLDYLKSLNCVFWDLDKEVQDALKKLWEKDNHCIEYYSYIDSCWTVAFASWTPALKYRLSSSYKPEEEPKIIGTCAKCMNNVKECLCIAEEKTCDNCNHSIVKDSTPSPCDSCNNGRAMSDYWQPIEPKEEKLYEWVYLNEEIEEEKEWLTAPTLLTETGIIDYCKHWGFTKYKLLREVTAETKEVKL